MRCFWSGFGRLLILVLVFVAVASASTATGDELAVSRGQRLVETSHRVDVTIENGTSTMIVRRTLENRGDAPNGTVLLARLPRGAAVTGFRTKVGTVWHAGEFVEADNLTEFDAGPVESNPRIPRTPMLLSWVGSDEVELRVFSVPGGARRTFEYTLTVPTAYENGRYSVTYPRATNGLATPQVKIRAPAGSSASGIAIDSRRVPGWKWTPLREPPASTDTSGIELTGSEDAVKAEVSVDIAHPYRGDLSVSLVPPIGDRIPLTTRTGGDEDNVTESFSVGLPNETPIGGIWSLSVVDHASLDVGTLRKWKVVVTAASGRKLAGSERPNRMIPDPSNSDTHEFATLQTGAPQIWPAAARLGLVDIESGRRFRRVEVDAAPKLSELPRDLSVVFVLDASRSLRDADFDGQLELVRAYLRHVPKARFELVVASRFAERVGEAFVPAKDVDALVARARKAGRFERKNGSALELGIEAAVDALAKRRGTRRVIVFSDGLLRTALRLEEATRPFARAKNVTTHLLVAEGSGSWSGFTRNDSHPLAPIATSSGGILAEYRTPKKTETKEMTPDTLGLIRPVRLDHLTIDGITTEPWRPERDALHEGSGFRTLIPAESATTRPVTVRGLLWSKPVAFEVGARESFAKKTAAWVVAAGDWHGLTPAEQLELALLGHAVSPVTSFVATGPGAEPSLGGRIGVGVSGPCGALPPVGVVPARRQPLGFDLESEFRAAAQSCKQAHPPPPDWTLVVAVETTWDEIVDVVVVPKGPSSLRVSGLSKLDTCIIEAIWDYEVPSGAMQNTRWAEQFTFK